MHDLKTEINNINVCPVTPSTQAGLDKYNNFRHLSTFFHINVYFIWLNCYVFPSRRDVEEYKNDIFNLFKQLLYNKEVGNASYQA